MWFCRSNDLSGPSQQAGDLQTVTTISLCSSRLIAYLAPGGYERTMSHGRAFSLTPFFTGVLLLLFIFATSEGKGASLEEFFKEETQRVLRDLEKNGVNQIGCKHLTSRDFPFILRHSQTFSCSSISTLREVLSKSEIIHVSELAPQLDRLPLRRSALSRRPFQILITDHLLAVPDLAGFLGLHELLQLDGRDDHDYDLTIYAYILLESKKNHIRPTHLPSFARAEINRVHELLRRPVETSFMTPAPLFMETTGSGTVVGGGGDVYGLSAQIAFFFLFLEQHRRAGESIQSALWRLPTLPVIEISAEKTPSISRLARRRDRVFVPEHYFLLPPQNQALALNRAFEIAIAATQGLSTTPPRLLFE